MNARHTLAHGLVAVCLCLPMGVSQLAHAQEAPDDYQVHRDIPYGQVDGRVLLLDLYLPHGIPEPPLLVWVHGGAWSRGSKNSVGPLGLTSAGYAIASVDFRLSGEAAFPAQIHDIKAAIRFLRAEAPTYGYDAERIAIGGNSSGGHLAAFVGVTNGHAALEGEVGDHLDESSSVQAIVDYYGPTNLASILPQSTPHGLSVRQPALDLLLGGQPEAVPELAELASVVTHVDATDPPLLILHGDQDPQVPINQSHELQGAYKELGLTVHFEVVHGAAHGGPSLVIFAVGLLPGVVLAQAPDPVFLEELTWTEVRDALAAGTTTVIIPTGGTEQNGPHMVLGKHNYLVRYKAGEVARRLGNALVAPVMAYVPEGGVDPPSGHMRFPGTITTPPEVFEQVLEFAARSFKQHGFLDIALLGDSGGNQASQAAVAERLNQEWAATPVRVHHLTDYYPGPGDAWLVTQGEREEDVGSHASMHDTASLMFLNPTMLRLDQLVPGTGGGGNGVVGNPARSTAAYGEQILDMQIDAAVRQIRTLRERSQR